MRTRHAALALLATLMVGCGSTVQVRGAATSGLAGDGLGGPNAPAGGGVDVPAEPAGPGRSGVPGASVDGPAVGAPGGQGGTSGPQPSAPAVRRTGLKPVQVGFQVTRNNASTASNFGFKLDNGNEREVVETLLAAANSTGGLAGHRIEPVWYELDPTTTQSYSTIGQEVCARFTEDARVIAAATYRLMESTNACLASKGIPALNGSTQMAYSEAQYAQLPTVASMGITPRREALAVVEAASRQGYLAAKPRVGIVSIDNAAFHDAVDNTLIPRLRAAGARVDGSDVVYGPVLEQTADVSRVATTMQSAVLRFRGSGVTHVVFLTDAGAPALLFIQQAQSQGATFRYALSSNDAPQVLVDQGVSARQLAGAVAAGWDPYLDVRVDKAGTPPTGRAWCASVLAKLKLAKGSNAEWVAHMHCDAVRLLLAAGARVTGDLTSSSLTAAIGRVGSFGSANAWSARITADHRWAVAGFRLNRYDGACGCFSYLSRETRPL